MAENCMKVSAASVANNPVVFTQEQIARAVRAAEPSNEHQSQACYEKSCGALIWRRRRGVYEF